MPTAPRRRGSSLVAVRRLPAELLTQTRDFLEGEDDALVETLCTQLLERQEARRVAGEVEEELRFLDDFYRNDAQRLRKARLLTGRSQPFVPRDERDSLFIRTRASD